MDQENCHVLPGPSPTVTDGNRFQAKYNRSQALLPPIVTDGNRSQANYERW